MNNVDTGLECSHAKYNNTKCNHTKCNNEILYKIKSKIIDIKIDKTTCYETCPCQHYVDIIFENGFIYTTMLRSGVFGINLDSAEPEEIAEIIKSKEEDIRMFLRDQIIRYLGY